MGTISKLQLLDDDTIKLYFKKRRKKHHEEWMAIGPCLAWKRAIIISHCFSSYVKFI